MISIFGLLYSLIVSIGSFFYKINENEENEQNKIQFKHPDGLTYVDTKGRSRLLSNNEIVFYTHDKNGDYVLENAYGYVYKNFSQEKRDEKISKNIKQAKDNNETTYCIDDNDHRNDWTCKGKRFKDVQTGDVYVIRCIKYSYYYLNIANGMIVRKTDWQIKYDEKMKNTYLYDELHYVDIESLNKKRENTQDKCEFYLDYKYNYNCDHYK